MIDIVIATYNRPLIIRKLVDDILYRRIDVINQVIVVDSSDEIDSYLQNKEIIYVRSTHKNQPYQRYLGYCMSSSDYLLFLDDDMQILNESIFYKIVDVFKDPSIVGINLRFTNKNDFLEHQLKHKFNFLSSVVLEGIRTLTGRPHVKDGQFWYCGLRGERKDGDYSEYFSGGAFCAKSKYLYKNFNFNLFTLFERRIGMGEDVILAYTLSKYGKIYNLPNSYFLHNDTGSSVYTANNQMYNYRVAYSRLYLSREYARLNGEKSIKAFVITTWFNFWRVLGLLVLCLRNPQIGIKGVWGYTQGALKSYGLYNKGDDTSYWKKEIIINLNMKRNVDSKGE